MHPLISLGQLLLQLGKVEGRKKFQKLVHILQCKGAPFQEGFELSHFGAYSTELKAELAALVNEDLATELKEQAGSNTVYGYAPTDKLVGLFHELAVPVESPWMDLAKDLNAKPARELEGISTVLYLQSRGWNAEALQTRFGVVKPHMVGEFEKYLESANRIMQS